MLFMSRLLAVGVLLAAVPAFAADAKYRIKSVSAPAPKELAEPIRKLMSEHAVQLTDSKGTVLCEVWLRKELPVKTTPEQIKNGLTYRDLEESTLLGAVRFHQPFSDYRKHKVKPGVYTLRLGFQPMDGDHMGTAPNSEFCLLIAAKDDTKPDLLETKQLQERSAKAIGGSHPGVFLLFPNEKPGDGPKLVEKENDHWVAMLKGTVSVGGQKTPAGLGIGLTLIGHSTAE
jgi:hypothetical protein